MLFDPFFEIGIIIIGFIWVCDQVLDSLINVYVISKADENESEIPESAKRMYS